MTDIYPKKIHLHLNWPKKSDPCDWQRNTSPITTTTSSNNSGIILLVYNGVIRTPVFS